MIPAGKVGPYYKRRTVWLKHPKLGWRQGIIKANALRLNAQGTAEEVWVDVHVFWADGALEMICTLPGRSLSLTKPKAFKGPAQRHTVSGFMAMVDDEEDKHKFAGPTQRGPRARR